MPGKIPDRWEKYSCVGEIIEGTRFIAFKVPLEERMTHGLKRSLSFTPRDLILITKSRSATLGHVVDLTNTNRYYDKQKLIDMGVTYNKINTEGHAVPSKHVRKRFFRVVQKFLQENAENDFLLGVHCTHGVNRTGYLLCRYMIDRMNFEPEQAIEGDCEKLHSPPYDAGDDSKEAEEEGEQDCVTSYKSHGKSAPSGRLVSFRDCMLPTSREQHQSKGYGHSGHSSQSSIDKSASTSYAAHRQRHRGQSLHRGQGQTHRYSPYHQSRHHDTASAQFHRNRDLYYHSRKCPAENGYQASSQGHSQKSSWGQGTSWGQSSSCDDYGSFGRHYDDIGGSSGQQKRRKHYP